MVKDEENPYPSSSTSSNSSSNIPFYSPFHPPPPLQTPPTYGPQGPPIATYNSNIIPPFPSIHPNSFEINRPSSREEEESPRNVWYQFRGQRSKVRVTNDFMDVDDMKHEIAKLFEIPFHTLTITRNGEVLEPNDPLHLYCSDEIVLTIRETGRNEAIPQQGQVYNAAIAVVESDESHHADSCCSCFRFGVCFLLVVILVILVLILLQYYEPKHLFKD